MKYGAGIVDYGDMETALINGADYLELLGKKTAALSETEFSELVREVHTLHAPILGFNAYTGPEVVIMGPGYDANKAREYAKKLSERGAALGVRKIGIGSPFSRRLPEDYDLKKAEDELLSFLSVTSDEAGKNRIMVGLENLGVQYCNTVNTLDEAYRIVKKLGDPNVHCLLDIYMMEHMGLADEELSAYSDEIMHAHLSDDENDIYKRSYLKPEKSAIHQSRIRKLIETGYNDSLTLEIDFGIDPVKLRESLSIMRGA